MLIKVKKISDILTSEITPKGDYLDRRNFMKGTVGLAAAGSLMLGTDAQAANGKDTLTTKESITHYNNFYEFGTGKDDPARNSKGFIPKPWQVTVDGEVENGGTFDFDELIRQAEIEERIYRMRCVEAWSMVIPWQGVQLSKILARFKATSKAKYIRFETLHDSKRMKGQRRGTIDWPYEEALTMAEALHPLTMIATGLYGEDLLPQNGAPLRLVVPWKYGFKSIKSIVRISFTSKMPRTSWNRLAPSEYGFFANVNPQVDHPRWTQASERRIGEFFRRDTVMFNGYSDEVAELYKGLNLKKYF
jgi:sulfoxide reductase catalytic subunit YedY